MNTKSSRTLLDAVEGVLPVAYGLTPAEVHRRLDLGARATVRQALGELVALGRATFDGPDRARSYRRRAADAD
jgi:hypothetical protein